MMAKRILVPIGTDERAETILPVVAALARAGGATVRLLRVQRPQRARYDVAARRLPRYTAYDTQVVHDLQQRLLSYGHVAEERLESEELERLRQLETLLDGVDVERRVRFGDVVDEITREARAFDADLIAVSQRARPWWRPALASVVQRLRARARVPVLALSGAAR
jgi:nucleotide-binding universal stress UspA family protein